MKTRLLAFGLLAVPALAFALDFTESSARYSDSHSFSLAERAGISVLTNLGAVSGNPDGTYAPGRTLNRAEFVKIVLKSAPSLDIIDTDEASCFPDVKAADWFSMYVCAAKRKGMVGGYPDGMFKPANPVNYVEAVKILTLLYGYNLPEPPANERWAWYTQYLRAADEHDVLMSGLSYDALLTRGQMARLAAAFRTEYDGDLDAYRAWEADRPVSSASSSSVSSSSSTSSSSSLVSSSSSSSSVSSVSSPSSASSAAAVLFPAASHFLITGETSPAIMDGVFQQIDEDGVLRRVTVTLRREIESFDSLVLVNTSGTEIAALTLATNNNADDRRFEAVVTDDRLTLTKDSSLTLGIRAKLKQRESGGVSNELVETSNFSIETQGKTSGNTRQIVPTNTHYPMHQTAYARISAVRNIATGSSVQAGYDRQIASFSISGKSVTGATLQLTSMEFILQKTNVSASHIRIGGTAALEQADCGLEQTDILRVTCTTIPESFRTISTTPRTIQVFADLAVANSGDSGSLQLLFEGRGKIGQNGALRWTDSTSNFNWVEDSTVLENGPEWIVTK